MPNVRVKVRSDVWSNQAAQALVIFPGIRRIVAEGFGIPLGPVDVEHASNAPGCETERPMITVAIDIRDTPEHDERAMKVKDMLRDQVLKLLPFRTVPKDGKVTIKLGKKHISSST